MFVCSRCGSSYDARHVGVEHCPRCRLRDNVEAPLAFKAFDLSSLRVTGLKTPGRAEGSGAGAGSNRSGARPSSAT
jgi:hypothetical protein